MLWITTAQYKTNSCHLPPPSWRVAPKPLRPLKWPFVGSHLGFARARPLLIGRWSWSSAAVTMPFRAKRVPRIAGWACGLVEGKKCRNNSMRSPCVHNASLKSDPRSAVRRHRRHLPPLHQKRFYVTADLGAFSASLYIDPRIPPPTRAALALVPPAPLPLWLIFTECHFSWPRSCRVTSRDTANGAKRRGAHCKDAFNASECLDLGMSHLLLLTALGLSFTSALRVTTM